MRKRIPILFLIALLAGILMGVAANGWAQDDEAAGHGSLHIWLNESQSFLGVQLEEVTSKVVERLGLPEERGALLTQVIPDSPAAKAGLRKDDVIVRWNGTPVESGMELRRHVRETPAGRTVHLGVFREGHEMDLTVTLGKRPSFKDRFREPLERARRALRSYDLPLLFSSRGRLGVTLQNLTPQLAEYFGLKDGSGALITSVREGSPAEQAGLKAGDIILAIDGQTVADPVDAMRVLAKKDAGPVDVRVLRDRQEKTITVTLEKPEPPCTLFAPEIDIRLDPHTLPDEPTTFMIPRFGIQMAPPMFRRLERLRARRRSPGVI